MNTDTKWVEKENNMNLGKNLEFEEMVMIIK